MIGAEGAQASLLQTEFPTLQILPLSGYHVRYKAKPNGVPACYFISDTKDIPCDQGRKPLVSESY